MNFANRGLLAGVALSDMAVHGAVLAQDGPVSLNIWSIDGASGRPGPFLAEVDELNEDIVVECRAPQFDELVTETLRAYASGNAPDIVRFDNPDLAQYAE